MNTADDTPTLTLAGRPVPHARDSIRRYCGLPWSGGDAEVWAFAYYDSLPSDPSKLSPSDVLAAGALHPGLSRTDLEFFVEHASRLNAWLEITPLDVELSSATDDVVASVAALADWHGGPSIALLSKVLHRKRPNLVPPVDRHMAEWYRLRTGERSPLRAWRPLLANLKADLGINGPELKLLRSEIETESGVSLSALRLIDISIWMGSRS